MIQSTAIVTWFSQGEGVVGGSEGGDWVGACCGGVGRGGEGEG